MVLFYWLSLFNSIQDDLRIEHELDTVSRPMEPDCDLTQENLSSGHSVIWLR